MIVERSYQPIAARDADRAVLSTWAAFSATADDEAPQQSSQWGLGLGAIASDNPYAGRGTRYTPFPLIIYDSNRLFFEGITAGVHVLDTSALQIDLVLDANFDGIDADQFGGQELAENGIDRNLLSDRKDSADAGFDVSFEGRYGELKLHAVTDVLDASGGPEVSVSYGYPLALGSRLTLTPSIGATWLSADRADYYYGILDKEVARGLANYRPGDVIIPELSVDMRYSLSERWLLMGNVGYKSLPSELERSPLLDSDRSIQLFIGVMRAF
jgi:outer membrane protein